MKLKKNISVSKLYAEEYQGKQPHAKATFLLNDLYDATCMIQLVWLRKIANSYKLAVQIFV